MTKHCAVEEPKGWQCNHYPAYQDAGSYDICACHAYDNEIAAECAGQPVPSLLPLVTPCCGARIGAQYTEEWSVHQYCTAPECRNEWDESGEPVTTFTQTKTGDI